jgi:hypothetical protein
MAHSNSNRRKSNLLLSSNFWIILGATFIMIGFLLAHLCNANAIHWPCEHERIADIIFHRIGPIFLFFGLIKALLEKVRK